MARRRILDTNYLIAQFRTLQPYAAKRPADAAKCARDLIETMGTDAIVAPVEAEFLCGVRDRRELVLADAFIKTFSIIDERTTLRQDWEEALRVAKRVGPTSEPRDMGDCLILGISERLRYVVLTNDKGLRRLVGRTRPRPG